MKISKELTIKILLQNKNLDEKKLSFCPFCELIVKRYGKNKQFRSTDLKPLLLTNTIILVIFNLTFG